MHYSTSSFDLDYEVEIVSLINKQLANQDLSNYSTMSLPMPNYRIDTPVAIIDKPDAKQTTIIKAKPENNSLKFLILLSFNVYCLLPLVFSL